MSVPESDVILWLLALSKLPPLESRCEPLPTTSKHNVGHVWHTDGFVQSVEGRRFEGAPAQPGPRNLARSEHSLSHSSKLFPRLIHHKQKGIFELCAHFKQPQQRSIATRLDGRPFPLAT